MQVVESDVCYPMNAVGGLYIQIEGTHEEIYGGAADKLAVQTANQKGWNGNGKATIGMPVRKGVTLYTRVYWFHDKR